MRRKHYIIISIVILLIISLILNYKYSNKNREKLNNNEETINNKEIPEFKKVNKTEAESITKKVKENTKNHVSVFFWNELGIAPEKRIDGSNYVFTAFDYDDNNEELILVGYYNQNKVLFVKNNAISELGLTSTPLDVLTKHGIIYVLCSDELLIIEEKKITKLLKHNIENVDTFDKLLFFDNNLYVLMSDGSSYQYSKKGFSESKSLLTKNKKEIWIQKTSINSFEIKTQPEDLRLNKSVEYDNQIGSITLLGDNSFKYYCIVDEIINKERTNVRRILKCSDDNFKRTVIELPFRNFSFIKNDIKIQKNKIYTATITEKNLILKSIIL